MARELDNVPFAQAEDLFEPPPDRLEHLLALGCGTAVLVTRNALAHGARPQSDAVEALAYVDHDAHHFIVCVILEGLADGRQLGVQPQIVNGNRALLAELERPFPAMLVLGILPLGPDAFFEQVVICLETQFGCWRDVVLVHQYLANESKNESAYVDPPELLHRVERDHLLQQVVPVIDLSPLDESRQQWGRPTLPVAGFVNHSVHSCIRGCFTVKFSGSWNTVTESPFICSFSSAATVPGTVFSLFVGTGPFSTAAAIVKVFDR